MIEDIGKYYLYRHIRLDKNEPFYIGIGTKKEKVNNTVKTTYGRAYTYSSRNNFWKNITSKTDYEVEILLESDDYEFIKQKEIEFIALYGRHDLNKGTLCNMTDGGDAYPGQKQTPDNIEKRRLGLIGRKLEGRALESAKENGQKKVAKNREILVGTEYKMNQGFWVKIIEYNGNANVLIEFLHTSERRVSAMTEIRKGSIRDYSELTSDKGFKGARGKNDKKETDRWKEFINKNIEEHGICKKWLDFHNFTKWYENNKAEDFYFQTHLFEEVGECDETNTYFIPLKIVRVLEPSKGYYLPKRGRIRINVYGYNPKGFDSKEEAIEAFKVAKKEYLLKLLETYKECISTELYNKIANSDIKIIKT